MDASDFLHHFSQRIPQRQDCFGKLSKWLWNMKWNGDGENSDGHDSDGVCNSVPDPWIHN